MRENQDAKDPAMNHNNHFVLGSWLPCIDHEASGLVQGSVYPAPSGLEPEQADPESAVLPLDDRAIVFLFYRSSREPDHALRGRFTAALNRTSINEFWFRAESHVLPLDDRAKIL